MDQLPIELVPGSNPPSFRWRQTVDTLAGSHTIECEGKFPPSIERALIKMINLVKQQSQEIIGLRRQVESHAARIAAQSELLTKKAENQTPAPKKTK